MLPLPHKRLGAGAVRAPALVLLAMLTRPAGSEVAVWEWPDASWVLAAWAHL